PGAGDKAFCTGGDQKVHLSEDGLYGPRGTVGMPIEEMQTALRDLRKVSIARVQGFAIGGGNVFATLCDLTIASEKAQFGQVGPKVGSVAPGRGPAYPAGLAARGEEAARLLVPLPPLQRRRGGEDGPCQQGRATRPARRRGRPVVQGDQRREPDRGDAR